MAEKTLLELTQDVLSSMNSDAVNSIGDTEESRQIARIIQNKYYDIISRGNLPEQNLLFQLDPSLDADKPTLMYVPAGVARIDWIKYFDDNPADNMQQDQFGAFSHDLNLDISPSSTWETTSSSSVLLGTGTKTFTVASSTLSVTVGQSVVAYVGVNGSAINMSGSVASYSGTTLVLTITGFSGTAATYSNWTIVSTSAVAPAGYKYVTMLPIDQFLDYINRLNPTDSDIRTWNFTEGGYNFNLYYTNDIQPKYCTVLETKYVLFDAYNNNFDDTLQSSKTMVYGNKITPFQLVDSFVPDMDDNQFPLLLNEAKALAFYELKQTPHTLADKEIKRQWSTVSKNKNIDNRPTPFEALPNYGRVPRTGGYSSGGYGAYRWMRQAGP